MAHFNALVLYSNPYQLYMYFPQILMKRMYNVHVYTQYTHSVPLLYTPGVGYWFIADSWLVWQVRIEKMTYSNMDMFLLFTSNSLKIAFLCFLSGRLSREMSVNVIFWINMLPVVLDTGTRCLMSFVMPFLSTSRSSCVEIPLVPIYVRASQKQICHSAMLRAG